MTLPALTPEKRAEIDGLASQQVNEGQGRLATGLESLDRATKAGDNAAMQEAVGMMREGLDELGAGIAARRVLSEGKSPRNLALDWFKREMSLASPIARQEPRGLLGIPPFHLFTMALLIAFALAMVAMYFFKMRRASALFGRIKADSGKPPPGSSPPLGGAPSSSSPATPPAGEGPPPGGTPPSSKTPTPSSPPAPQSGKSPATGPPAGGAPPDRAPRAGGGPPASASAQPSEDAAKLGGRANELWQARGRPVGSPEVDWSRAKEELAKAADKPPTEPAAGGTAVSPAIPPASKAT
jgi:hypothetical protein